MDAFVKRVVAWSQLLQRCADGALQRAHDAYMHGSIDLDAYNDVLSQKIEIAQKCAEMIDAASRLGVAAAQQQLAPLQQAADQLEDAAKAIDKIQDGVLVASELFAAAVAVTTAVTAPSLASIAAAGAAIGAVAGEIKKQAAG
jgi:hypothetical protein